MKPFPYVFLLSLLMLLNCAGVLRAGEDALASRTNAPLTILQLNDVYSAAALEDGKVGGLARVASLAEKLRGEGHTVVLTLSGDFLSPSVESSIFQGKQMVDALNALPLDLATLGNHEFDFGVPVLRERMRETKFQWIVANVLDEVTGQIMGGAAPYVIRSYGPLKVGFIGLCLSGDEISPRNRKGAVFLDPLQTAAQYLPKMKQEGANVIVALTHLEYGDDVKLARNFPEIDLILGGHEHFAIASAVGSTFISKADPDARTVARHDLNRVAPDAPLERHYELIPVTSVLPDEPRVASVVAEYQAKLSVELDTPVGRSDVELDAVAEAVRSQEVNLGNLFADAMKAATGAELAIINGGSIRSNRVYPVGPLTRRDLLAMHPFGGTAVTVEATGATILAALENGVSKIGESAGRFPQVSGVTFAVDPLRPVGQRVSEVKINGQPLEAGKTYVVAIGDYMLEGGDGYAMFAASKVLLNAESSPQLIGALEAMVKAQDAVAPRVENRIRVARVRAAPARQKRPILLDTDMGIDSVLGMLYLLRSPQVEVRAVTVANGIAHVEAGALNARRILELTGYRDIPVAAGRSTPLQGERAFPSFWREQADTLGGEETLKLLPPPVAPPFAAGAADLILQTLENSDEPVTIVALGPLTNIALALQKRPAAARRIQEIIVMGGALRQPGNVDKPFVGIKNSVAEWNFYVDPHAARLVLESGAPVRLLPLDATRSLPIAPEFVQRLREGRRDATSNLLLALLNAVNDGIEGGWYFFWDTLAAVVAARPEVAGSYTANIEVVTDDGPTLGQTKPRETGGFAVKVGEEVNRQTFEDDYLKTVLDTQG